MGLCVKILRDIHSYCVLCYGSVCEGTGIYIHSYCVLCYGSVSGDTEIYTLILCIVLWVCVWRY